MSNTSPGSAPPPVNVPRKTLLQAFRSIPSVLPLLGIEPPAALAAVLGKLASCQTIELRVDGKSAFRARVV